MTTNAKKLMLVGTFLVGTPAFNSIASTGFKRAYRTAIDDVKVDMIGREGVKADWMNSDVKAIAYTIQNDKTQLFTPLADIHSAELDKLHKVAIAASAAFGQDVDDFGEFVEINTGLKIDQAA